MREKGILWDMERRRELKGTRGRNQRLFRKRKMEKGNQRRDGIASYVKERTRFVWREVNDGAIDAAIGAYH